MAEWNVSAEGPTNEEPATEANITEKEAVNAAITEEQGAAWDLIFMTVKKPHKKFPTKVTNKDKKKSNLAWTHKKIQKRVNKYIVTKKNFH